MNEKQLIISYESFLKQDNEDKYNMLEEAVYEIERLNNIIDVAINKMQDIRDLGFDYDGFNNVEDLKGLIDTLVDIAGQSIKVLTGLDNGNNM